MLSNIYLVTAASKGHRSVVDFLLSVPAMDIFVRNLQNETAYDIAAERGDIKVYEEIEAHEGNVWARNNPNSTYPYLSQLTYVRTI